MILSQLCFLIDSSFVHVIRTNKKDKQTVCSIEFCRQEVEEIAWLLEAKGSFFFSGTMNLQSI